VLFGMSVASTAVWVQAAWLMATAFAIPRASRIQGVRTLLHDPLLYYHAALIACSALGTLVRRRHRYLSVLTIAGDWSAGCMAQVSEFFFSLYLLDLFMRSQTLLQVLLAVTANGQSLALTRTPRCIRLLAYS
jgi:hypothetical protein